MITSQVILKKGREKSVLNRHPWIFSGAIERVEGGPADGDVVDVWDSRARFVARGIINQTSQIVVRILTWDQDELIGEGFWRGRLERAIRLREPLAADPLTDAYRLVHAEADGLPGLIVDRYGPWLVVQFLSLAVERHKAILIDHLADLTAPQGILNRSDDEVREKEGLVAVTNHIWGEVPPDLIEIAENGFRFMVDINWGQKTGFYLDQRDNRKVAQHYCRGAEVLNAFAYTGAFAVYAASGGAARIVNVDSSEEVLKLAERNMRRNGFGAREDVYAAANAFELLRAYRDYGWHFDVVILDPPKFAQSKSHVTGAMRGYKDINLLGMKLLRPGGYLITFSCSGAIGYDLFQKVLFEAAVDANRDVHIVERLGQGIDHPVLLTFPESQYLKGFVCRVW
jgi:23S rRNA (cytosine1962-C5)-methyltransferase